MLSASTPLPEQDQSEIRLMGLILMQSMSIGLAVGIFDADLWIDLNDPMVNGVTYSMAAFAVQGLAYYLFKMFFQQGMDEKARLAAMERERRNRYRSMEVNFDSRRQAGSQFGVSRRCRKARAARQHRSHGAQPCARSHLEL